ncbi:type ISP restriction/modification enzyme [Desulfomonile tiedjei]|uniref:site-specific DNA-methyltransferase (adenine-specific) n=1 Tax=Desulfomonile tiedjei (strain ATCC 49306 / DSM 6799 / DCB-1) TaxID=706587 RepID=I4C962_DESTA|nr:type ISP restriction/modification enzyme [Desulfomonile tiedjei]AFM26103.1 putative helicase [Desulfomonile tiedjei DSM 6799]
MPTLDLKTNHKAVKEYYAGLEEFHRLGVIHETAVRAAFQRLLEHCCKQTKWTFVGEYKYLRKGQRPLSVDGAAVDGFKIPQAYWEAKDTQDDLPKEVQKKFEKGYPRNNIVFQSPDRAILWQDSRQILDGDITKPDTLVYVVKELFAYQPQSQRDWEAAVEEFKQDIPASAAKLVELIETERKDNKSFVKAFNSFSEVCRSSINPNLSDAAVEEMLVQHLLTERIFRKVFHNSEFTDRNIIAREIERVIHALTSRKFSREEFLRPLDRFYGALERRAETLDDYSQQQTFLNTVYEKFFQGFAVKQADTHGIVYTPQPIVDFMVRSVEEILKREFGKSLSDEGVHIIDPFVGTGNFVTRIMREMKKTSLPQKYSQELHCNEVMLLPYYVASMNIEHEYYERTGEYKPFEGICLVDTFELAESKQLSFMFTQENTERVEKLRKTKLFVIIGNPPYNAHQLDENDKNKNRKYKTMDKRVAETYSKDSLATNKNALSDPYVKAIRWASDKILESREGVVAFVSNSNFVSDFGFDGMRKHLLEDFDLIYVLDLGGNVRKNPKISGTTHNVFGIQVGVSINLFVRLQNHGSGRFFYSRVDDFWKKEQKFSLLESCGAFSAVKWEEMSPDGRHSWLTSGMQPDFPDLLPMGTKETKAGMGNSLFKLFSSGIKTNRDSWVYNFDETRLSANIRRIIETYNDHVIRWSSSFPRPDVDSFVEEDVSKISWSEGLKTSLQRGKVVQFRDTSIRKAHYRPFTSMRLYLDPILAERCYRMPIVFPSSHTETENLAICVGAYGRKAFSVLMVDGFPDVNFFGDPHQVFPLFTYSEDGSDRRENITDWATEQFSSSVKGKVNKRQIFHYIYAALHSPEYREKYQANLKRELPRIPAPKTIDQFCAFVSAGERLADLHINYESQPEHPLEKIENPDKTLNWRVEKMKLTKDKTAIVYNDFLTLAGIPPEAFEYRLGNRSALEWIIDRYQVHTDKRSGIVNDPNRADDPQYIVKLIGKIITVSLETMKTVKSLPQL